MKTRCLGEYPVAGSSAAVAAAWWRATAQEQSNMCSLVSLCRKTWLPETTQQQNNMLHTDGAAT